MREDYEATGTEEQDQGDAHEPPNPLALRAVEQHDQTGLVYCFLLLSRHLCRIARTPARRSLPRECCLVYAQGGLEESGKFEVTFKGEVTFGEERHPRRRERGQATFQCEWAALVSILSSYDLIHPF